MTWSAVKRRDRQGSRRRAMLAGEELGSRRALEEEAQEQALGSSLSESRLS